MEQIALVTGANRGIGFETCRQLADAGFHTILTARDETSGAHAARSLGVDFLQLDVTDQASVARAAEVVEARHGRLDVLVNNAGVSDDPGGVVESDPARVRRMMEVNFFGAMAVSRALVPLLLGSDDARIINVTTGMAQLSKIRGNHAGYRLSKAALNALTVLLAAELQDTPVTVNGVSPGNVRTAMGGPNARLSVEAGAAHVVRLATRRGPLPTGRFFSGKRERPW